MLMRKCRWVHMALLALCTIGTMAPVSSWALGLGEIDVESALNERFVGTIPVVDGQGYGKSEIMVSLASREDFERVGVERFFYLTNLKFDVQIDGNGQATVNISSSQPVSEPYLNFIVEVLWPQGRLLKEFTVLLDPPTYSEVAVAPAVSAPVQSATPSASRPAPASSAQTGTRVRVPPAAPPASRRPAWDNSEGLMTTRDDTLWKIASRTLPSDRVSVHQQMLAIQRKNPEAFMRDNVNLLKAGYVLELPTEGEALATTQEVAIADVAEQTQAWREGRPVNPAAGREAIAASNDQQPQMASQVDATAADRASSSGSTSSGGDVRIVASTGDLASGTASGDDPSVNQLIETNETLVRQVDELNYQLDREKEIATNQVTVKDRQLEVKDQEIAQLQERLMQQEAALKELQQNQNQSATTPEPAGPWWSSPMVLFGVIAALVLILVFALLGLRRARSEAVAAAAAPIEYAPEPVPMADDTDYLEVEDVEHEDAITAAAAAGAVGMAAIEPIISADDDAEDGGDAEIAQLYEADGGEDEAPLELDDEDGGQTGDVIGEAEIYIAYGRYGQAVNLLTNFLDKEPERHDVRLKLLEVYVESHDRAGFDEQAAYLGEHCDDPAILDAVGELQGQLQANQLDLTSESEADVEVPEVDSVDSLADVDTAGDVELSADAPDLDAPELDGDFELELDGDLSEGVALTDDAPAAAEEFELEFDADDSVIDEAAAGAGAALGGDLGMDFDPDRDVEESLQTVSDADDELQALDDLVDDVSTDLTEQAADATPDLEEDLLDLDELGDVSLDADDGADDALSTASEPAEDFEDDFDFGGGADADINATKIDLAEAYIDMGDADGARDILREVLDEGTDEQRARAQELLDGIG